MAVFLKIAVIAVMVLNVIVQLLLTMYIAWRNVPRADRTGQWQVLTALLVSSVMTVMFVASLVSHPIGMGVLNQICGYIVLQLLVYWLGYGLGRPLNGPLRE